MTLTDKRIEWKARIDAWKSSGLSAAEWCREQDLKVHQMYYWIQKFERDVTSEQGTDTQWLTVNVKNDPTSHTGQEPARLFVSVVSILGSSK